jgi:hypothetical protein
MIVETVVVKLVVARSHRTAPLSIEDLLQDVAESLREGGYLLEVQDIEEGPTVGVGIVRPSAQAVAGIVAGVASTPLLTALCQ